MAPGEPSDLARTGREERQLEIPAGGSGQYRVVATLMYRKVDQFLINFLLGEDSGLTAPVIEMNTVEITVDVREPAQQASVGGGGMVIGAGG